jgi:hypothetical protein
VTTHKGLGAAVAGLLVLVSALSGPSAPRADGALREVRARASADTVATSAVRLAGQHQQVDLGDATVACPTEDMRVRWEPVPDPGPAALLEQIGASPPVDTTRLAGAVVCRGDADDVLAFEASWRGGVWQIDPLPLGDVVIAPPVGEEPPPEPLAIDLAHLPEGLPVPVDDYADYEPQQLCDPTVKPGARAMASLLLDAVPGTAYLGITRDCSQGPVSEHKEGRAFDWAVAPSQRPEVAQVLARLLATDAAGNPHALARRMGVMYIIWNGSIWASYRADAGWRPFTGRNPHDGHVHISLSRDGAAGRTTLWQAGLEAGWWDLPPALAPPPVVAAVADLPPMPEAPPEPPAPPRPSSGPSDPAVAADDPPTPAPTEVPPDPTAAPSPSEPADEPTPSEAPVPAEDAGPPVRVLVRLAGGAADPSVIDSLRTELGATLVHGSRLVPGLETWEVPGDRVEATVARLGERGEVLRAEVDATIVATPLPEPPTTPDDGPDAVDEPPVEPDVADDAPPEPDTEPGVAVAVVGDRFDGDAAGWDACDPADVMAERTGPDAGRVPAAGTGGLVAPFAAVATFRVICADGTGLLSDALAAIDDAVAAGVPVSVHGWVPAASGSALLADVVAAAQRAGHVVVGGWAPPLVWPTVAWDGELLVATE